MPRFNRVGVCTFAIVVAGVLVAVAWGQRGTGGANAANGGGGRGYAHGLDDSASPQSNPSDIARAKAMREQNLKDATRLAELAEKVRKELEEGSSYTLSLATLKTADEMTKLSKKLYSELKSAGTPPDAGPPGFDATNSTTPKK